MQAFVNGELDVLGVTPAQLRTSQKPRQLGHQDVDQQHVQLRQFQTRRSSLSTTSTYAAGSLQRSTVTVSHRAFTRDTPIRRAGPSARKSAHAYSDLSGLASQTFSTDKAKEFLKNGNFDLGTTVPFSTFTQTPFSTEADAVAEQLQNVGIKVDLSKEEFGSWAQKIYTAKNFTVMNSGQTTATVDPDEILYPLFHSKGDLNASFDQRSRT